MNKFTLLLAGALASSAANAQFIVIEDGDAASLIKSIKSQQTSAAPLATTDERQGYVSVRVPPVLRTVIVNKGARPSDIPSPSIEGMTNASIFDSLAAVIPQGFGIYSAEGVTLTDMITFRSEGNWATTLALMLAPTDLTATINWDVREVKIAVDKPYLAYRKTRPTAPVVAKSAMPAGPQMSWAVRTSDGMLSQSVQRWCKESARQCVRIDWGSNFDVPIEVDAEFKGDFMTSMRKLFASMQMSTGHTFHYGLTENGVLLISDESNVSIGGK